MTSKESKPRAVIHTQINKGSERTVVQTCVERHLIVNKAEQRREPSRLSTVCEEEDHVVLLDLERAEQERMKDRKRKRETNSSRREKLDSNSSLFDSTQKGQALIKEEEKGGKPEWPGIGMERTSPRASSTVNTTDERKERMREPNKGRSSSSCTLPREPCRSWKVVPSHLLLLPLPFLLALGL